jgi:hypothetical protein
MAHLSDDETVAKMGHPDLLWVDLGHPPGSESQAKQGDAQKQKDKE